MRKLYRFGPFELETQRFELCREGTRQPLSASLTKLLILFADRPAELITRDEIATCLWKNPQYVDAASGINTAVNRLRAALGDDPSNPVYIETVVSLGYRFIATVDRTLDAGAEEILSAPSALVSQGDLPALAMAGDAAVLTESTIPRVAIGPRTADATAKGEEGASSAIGKVPDRVGFAWISRNSLYLKASVLFATLIILALSGPIVAHRLRPSPDRVDEPSSLPPTNMGFTQVTSNDGSNRITVESLSHRGQRIAFSDRDGLSVRDLDSGANQLLPMPSTLHIVRIAWYPGDDQLLVSGKRSKENQSTQTELEVWVVSLRGERPRLILTDATDAVVSPDGKDLVFAAHQGTEIWIAGAFGESPRKLWGGAARRIYSSLLWAPQGGRLVYQSCRTPEVSGMSLEGSQRTYQCDYESLGVEGKLLATEPDVRFSSAYLLSDGSLCFPENKVGPQRADPRLVVIKTDPKSGHFLSKPHMLESLRGDLVPEVSASDDGKRIAILLERASSEVYVGDIRFPGAVLEHVHRLVHPAPENYPHSWTPGSDSVVFESNDLGKYAIYKQKLDGSSATLLARAPQDGALPQVAPGGKWVLFENFSSVPGLPPRDIFRVPLDGGKLQQVLTHGQFDDFSCSISSQGSCVLREKIGNEFVFFLLDPVLGQGRELGRVPWVENSLGDWNVSPDGTTIAMPIHGLDDNSIRLVKLGTMTLSKTIDTPVPDAGTLLEISWAPNSRGFYVESKTATGFALLYVDRQGHSTVLRNTHAKTWGIASPNGKEVAFVEQTANTNVWMATGHP